MGKFYWQIGKCVFIFNVLLVLMADVNNFMTGKSFPSDLKVSLTQGMVMCIGLMLIGKKMLDDQKR